MEDIKLLFEDAINGNTSGGFGINAGVVHGVEDAAQACCEIHNNRIADLKEALSEAILQLEYVNEKQERGTTNSVISRLKTLIGKL